MKLIAHRGASLERPENTLESLIHAARLGADAVECDVRHTKDGAAVIFHDSDLRRLAGVPLAVSELTFAQMREALAAAGRGLLTLAELAREYRETTPVLLHIKMDAVDADFARFLAASPVDFICGVQSLEVLQTVRETHPPSRILAFVPEAGLFPAFFAHGAGIIRLWEHWLDEIRPVAVRERVPAEVWIMAHKNGSLDGDAASLDRAAALGADGMLLNDISLGLRWRAERAAGASSPA